MYTYIYSCTSNVGFTEMKVTLTCTCNNSNHYNSNKGHCDASKAVKCLGKYSHNYRHNQERRLSIFIVLLFGVFTELA